MQLPDFFVVGGPKCGTSALSHYLKSNPSIGFSIPEEPHYFSQDFDEQLHGFRDLDHYLASCFGHLKRHYQAVGEGSVTYCYSELAIEMIRGVFPDAKIIFMTRDPVSLAYAWFQQNRRTLREDCRTFEAAWDAQDSRLCNKKIPRTCRDFRLLQYRRICAQGSQLSNILRWFDRDKVLVLKQEDLASDPRKVYSRTLGFLGVDDDGRDDFPRINSNRNLSTMGRIVFLAKRALFSNSWMKRTWGRVISPAGRENLNRIAYSFGSRVGPAPPLPNELRNRIGRELAEESALLRGLTEDLERI